MLEALIAGETNPAKLAGLADRRVKASPEELREALRITSIPGVKNLGAHVLVSEVGIDMSRFPSAAHLLSWACICPRNDESAGKRRSNRMRKARWRTAPERDRLSLSALVHCLGHVKVMLKRGKRLAGPILQHWIVARF
jgi:transposase